MPSDSVRHVLDASLLHEHVLLPPQDPCWYFPTRLRTRYEDAQSLLQSLSPGPETFECIPQPALWLVVVPAVLHWKVHSDALRISARSGVSVGAHEVPQLITRLREVAVVRHISF